MNRNDLDDYIYNTTDVKLYQVKKVHVTKNMAVMLHNLLNSMRYTDTGLSFTPTAEMVEMLKQYTLNDVIDCYVRLGLNKNSVYSDYQWAEARKYILNKQYNAKMRDWHAKNLKVIKKC